MIVVLLPGLDGTGDLFASFVAELHPAYTVTVVRYPTERRYSYSELEELVSASLPVNREYILLGESFSGPIAVSIAAKQPEGLVGVVLCCSFVRSPARLLSLLRPLIRLLPVSGVPTGVLEYFLLGEWSTRTLALALKNAISKVPSSILRSRLQLVAAVDVEDRLQSIVVPLLYLQAASDRLVPTSMGRNIKTSHSQATLYCIEGPHALLQTRPVRSAMVVNEFIQSLEGRFRQ